MPYDPLFLVLAPLIVIACGLLAALVVHLIFRVTLTAWLPRAIERAVIGQIASVVRQNLPLATALNLAAHSERGHARRCLHRIAGLLARGLPLSEAVHKGMRLCSALTLGLIVTGEKTGRLADALDQAEANLIDTAHRHRYQPVFAVPYLVVMLAVMTLLTSALMVAIVPRLKCIFEDFGAELPGVTRALIAFSAWWVQTPAWLVAFLIAGIALFFWLRPRRHGRPRLASRLADHLRWHLPVSHRFAVSRNLAAAMQTIRLAVRSGLDLAPAADLAARTDLNVCLQRRLRRFGELLKAGTDVRQAVRETGLGEITAIALAAGQRAGDLEAGLRFAIDYHEALVGRARAVLRNLAVPAVVFVAASGAAWIVLALFLPLVSLINATTSCCSMG